MFEILDKITAVLDKWQSIKEDNNLTDELIEQGKQILQEAKNDVG